MRNPNAKFDPVILEIDALDNIAWYGYNSLKCEILLKAQCFNTASGNSDRCNMANMNRYGVQREKQPGTRSKGRSVPNALAVYGRENITRPPKILAANNIKRRSVAIFRLKTYVIRLGKRPLPGFGGKYITEYKLIFIFICVSTAHF